MTRGPSLRSLAVAATADSATPAAVMSCRPYFRGGRSGGRRGYSGRPLVPAIDSRVEFVSGDSHFNAVHDANSSFRQGYTNVPPPPPQYASGQQFYGSGAGYHQPGAVPQQIFGMRPHNHRKQGGPAFANYQQFRPQQTPQQFRPRASKPPDYREWEFAKPGPPPNFERFTVLSYNILADYLAMDHWQQLYFHIPQYILDWNWRKKNISFELGLWSADILCFQEVDRFRDIEAELKPRGYSGVWKMRTGDAADGCAIFWRSSRFKLVHEESIQYNKLGLRDNVAQICVFESLNPQNKKSGASTPSASSAGSNRVIICNIHVLFNPKRGDIKLGQIRVLLDRAHAVSKLWDDAPIVICGDFNCTPKSPLYNFISGQKLDLSNLPRVKVSGQHTAELNSSRPPYHDFRIPAAENSQASPLNSTLTSSDVLCESTSAVSMSSLSEEADKTTEENAEASDSFLSELHGTGAADSDSSSLNQKPSSHVYENLNDPRVNNAFYCTWAWTRAEIETATGNAECMVAEHPLKLTSAYAEVESPSGLRDPSGEPHITSYHKRFSGTVDYIWHSEGVQTNKVLAPIPKHVMHQTRGFPTRKWGSDHIALVSEFAFTNGISSEHPSQ